MRGSLYYRYRSRSRELRWNYSSQSIQRPVSTNCAALNWPVQVSTTRVQSPGMHELSEGGRRAMLQFDCRSLILKCGVQGTALIYSIVHWKNLVVLHEFLIQAQSCEIVHASSLKVDRTSTSPLIPHSEWKSLLSTFIWNKFCCIYGKVITTDKCPGKLKSQQLYLMNSFSSTVYPSKEHLQRLISEIWTSVVWSYACVWSIWSGLVWHGEWSLEPNPEPKIKTARLSRSCPWLAGIHIAGMPPNSNDVHGVNHWTSVTMRLRAGYIISAFNCHFIWQSGLVRLATVLDWYIHLASANYMTRQKQGWYNCSNQGQWCTARIIFSNGICPGLNEMKLEATPMQQWLSCGLLPQSLEQQTITTRCTVQTNELTAAAESGAGAGGPGCNRTI